MPSGEVTTEVVVVEVTVVVVRVASSIASETIGSG